MKQKQDSQSKWGNAVRKGWEAGSITQQVFLECHDEPGTVLGLETNPVYTNQGPCPQAADILGGRRDNTQDKYVKYDMARLL